MSLEMLQDLTDVKYHFENTVVVETLQLLELV